MEFKTGDHVVYPTHGVGTVQGIRIDVRRGSHPSGHRRHLR
ncbi:CarD family transcriptional regulator [Dankookia sp. P2]